MFLSVYVCEHVCLSLCMCVCMCVNVSLCVCVCVNMYVSLCVYTYVYMGIAVSTTVLEKTLESPLDCKEIKSVTPNEISPEYSLEGLMAEGEAPILWPPDVKN